MSKATTIQGQRSRDGSSLVVVCILLLVIVTALAVYIFGRPVAERIGSQSNRPATPIPHPFLIELTGHDHKWYVKYPNEKGEPARGKSVAPASVVRVPRNAEVVLILKSTDYLYNVSIPELGLREVAVPDLEFRLTFHPKAAGSYKIFGEQLCGDPRQYRMAANLVVQPQRRLSNWLYN